MNSRELAQKYRAEIDSFAAQAIKRPYDFGWHGRKEMFDTWALGPCIEHRDSDVLTRSNAITIKKMLEDRLEFKGQWEINGCNHWAVGWVDHLSFKVYQVVLHTRVITPGAAWIKENYFDALADYPVLDEDLWSEMEYTEAYDGFEDCLRYFLGSRDEYEHLDKQELLDKYDLFGIVYDLDPDMLYNEGYTDDQNIIKAIESLDIVL